VPGRSYIRLLPEALGIACRGLSGKLQAALYDFGIEDSFRLATYRLNVHYGFALCPERIRQATLKTAKALSEGLKKREPVRTLPAQGAEAIIAQCDGSMVRLVATASTGDKRKQRQLEWKEARLCAAVAKENATIFYEGLMGDVEETGEAWSQAVFGAGWGIATYIQPMGDGAVWIDEQAAIRFPGSRFILDLCHVGGYLEAAAPSCARREKPKRWLQRQKNKLLKGRQKQVIAELAAKREPAHLPDDLAPVRTAHRYLAAREHQLDYPEALKRGLPVGTGMIESAHKQIIQKRLKGPGMAWLPNHADALIKARAHRATQIQNPKCLKFAA
jgi:hypothetical protein